MMKRLMMLKRGTGFQPVNHRLEACATLFLLVSGPAFAADTATNPAPAHPALADYPAAKAPYIAAYRWGAANKSGGAKANEAFAKWLGQPVVWAEDFEPTERWDDNIEGGD